MSEIFLVGGAVRDELLELPVKERDWVVVGSSEEELLNLGYISVGKDFPVFLHPETKEEHALARKERKVGPGHKGFEIDSNKGVSLEEDLERRDLTINAIAKTKEGILIDPYGGLEDINNRTLRKVSDAFAEDPLRVFRVARFAAKFDHLGFKIEKETLNTMKKISSSGELETLPKERLWQETNKALEQNSPEIYFNVLLQVNALNVIKEIDKFDFSILGKVTEEIADPKLRWALLAKNINSDIDELSQKLGVPKKIYEFAFVCNELFRFYYKKGSNPSAKDILNLINQVDGIRRKERFKKAINLLEFVDSIEGFLEENLLISDELIDKLSSISPSRGLEDGKEISKEIERERLKIINLAINENGK
ncbi:MAG: multifunctional CCA tRNA nucleotidyl transferase/2'3'-cyclic phosphodiesterase/2'nucleotidase/phosphatase [Gammaproteobacteria bacterium]